MPPRCAPRPHPSLSGRRAGKESLSHSGKWPEASTPGPLRIPERAPRPGSTGRGALRFRRILPHPTCPVSFSLRDVGYCQSGRPCAVQILKCVDFVARRFYQVCSHVTGAGPLLPFILWRFPWRSPQGSAGVRRCGSYCGGPVAQSGCPEGELAFRGNCSRWLLYESIVSAFPLHAICCLIFKK